MLDDRQVQTLFFGLLNTSAARPTINMGEPWIDSTLKQTVTETVNGIFWDSVVSWNAWSCVEAEKCNFTRFRKPAFRDLYPAYVMGCGMRDAGC